MKTKYTTKKFQSMCEHEYILMIHTNDYDESTYDYKCKICGKTHTLLHGSGYVNTNKINELEKMVIETWK